MKCAGHILRESLYCGFRPCHSVFIGGGHIFRPGFFTCDHLNSNIGGVVVGGRLGRTTAVHGSHANIPHSWRIPASRQGFNVLFFFIHQGRSVHLFQRVFGAVGGCLPVLAGVWGCWQALVTPHVLWFRHVIQAGLRLFTQVSFKL